jgi:hypothetical protein
MSSFSFSGHFVAMPRELVRAEAPLPIRSSRGEKVYPELDGTSAPALAASSAAAAADCRGPTDVRLDKELRGDCARGKGAMAPEDSFLAPFAARAIDAAVLEANVGIEGSTFLGDFGRLLVPSFTDSLTPIL